MLVFHPDHKIYSIWKFLIGIASVFSCGMYTLLLAEGLPEILSLENFFIACLELIFFVDIVLHFFMAFNEDGYGEYEFSFQKTYKKYFYSIKFKIHSIVWMPLGYFGAIHSFARILFIVKLWRIQLFIYIFQYHYYHPALKNIQASRIQALDQKIREKSKKEKEKDQNANDDSLNVDYL